MKNRLRKVAHDRRDLRGIGRVLGQSVRLGPDNAAYYSTRPLERTLGDLVDFDHTAAAIAAEPWQAACNPLVGVILHQSPWGIVQAPVATDAGMPDQRRAEE